jgi:tRNA threonylcarbamoyladenosine biosynthesis protein TsaB
MIILGIETSGDPGSVALCREEVALAVYSFGEGARHARGIVPAIDEVVRRAGIGKAEIEAAAVSEGPGSFTGLRVGAICAKALALAMGWKLVGVPSLEVLVQNVTQEMPPGCRFACPLRDARRGRVYGTVFEWDGAQWRDTTGVLLEEPRVLAAKVPEAALVFGSGVRAYPEAFAAGSFRVGDRSLEVGRAEMTARLGLRRMRAGQTADPMRFVPLYYRLTEAEEKLSPGGP